MDRAIICIDLKTFFASVECVERGLDPFTTNLVVADESRGNGTICLAISPRMKMLGVKNRCRVFEIPTHIKYIKARPRMSMYIKYAADIYQMYLEYISKEDIHVYSIDEVFIDATDYLKTYNMKATEFAKFLMNEIYKRFGLTATAGVGTNLYLAKIALDIMSKHNATNIGWLTEEKYKKELWDHKPLSDFWQIGRGIEKRLNKLHIYTMEDLAHASESKLYREFGINAELLIDHSKGIETCTMKDIKAYKPKSKSISGSQVLFEDYPWQKARIILKEMVELKSIELVDKGLVTNNISLYIGYSKDIIRATGGQMKLSNYTNVYTELSKYMLKLFDKTTNPNYPIRRIGVGFNNVQEEKYIQLDFFINTEKQEKEKNVESAISKIKLNMGKNAVLRGTSYEEGATAKLRNTLIGGHNAN